MADSFKHCDEPCVPYKVGSFLLVEEVLAYHRYNSASWNWLFVLLFGSFLVIY